MESVTEQYRYGTIYSLPYLSVKIQLGRYARREAALDRRAILPSVKGRECVESG